MNTQIQTLQNRMEKAFDLVKGADWRAPISKVVFLEDLKVVPIEEIVEAVEFYTATRAYATPVEIDGQIHGVLVTAVGYRMGPAGP